MAQSFIMALFLIGAMVAVAVIVAAFADHAAHLRAVLGFPAVARATPRHAARIKRRAFPRAAATKSMMRRAIA